MVKVCAIISDSLQASTINRLTITLQIDFPLVIIVLFLSLLLQRYKTKNLLSRGYEKLTQFENTII